MRRARPRASTGRVVLRPTLRQRDFALVGADANKEPAVAGAIRSPFTIDFDRHNAPSIVESETIDEGNYRRRNFFAADAHELVLNFFGVIDAFDAQLVVHAEHDHSTAGVRERNDALI